MQKNAKDCKKTQNFEKITQNFAKFCDAGYQRSAANLTVENDNDLPKLENEIVIMAIENENNVSKANNCNAKDVSINDANINDNNDNHNNNDSYNYNNSRYSEYAQACQPWFCRNLASANRCEVPIFLVTWYLNRLFAVKHRTMPVARPSSRLL